MKTKFLIAAAAAVVALLIIWKGPAFPQLIPGTIISTTVVPVAATPVGITCADLGIGRVTALIQPLGASIRFELNGDTPSLSTSYLLLENSFFAVGNAPGFRAVRSAAVTASLKVSCIQG